MCPFVRALGQSSAGMRPQGFPRRDTLRSESDDISEPPIASDQSSAPLQHRRGQPTGTDYPAPLSQFREGAGHRGGTGSSPLSCPLARRFPPRWFRRGAPGVTDSRHGILKCVVTSSLDHNATHGIHEFVVSHRWSSFQRRLEQSKAHPQAPGAGGRKPATVSRGDALHCNSTWTRAAGPSRQRSAE